MWHSPQPPLCQRQQHRNLPENAPGADPRWRSRGAQVGRSVEDWWVLDRWLMRYPTKNWVVVVSNMFHFHPYLGKWSNLTNVFQMGWFNHQLESCGFLGLNRWNSIFEPTLIREWGGMRCVFFCLVALIWNAMDSRENCEACWKTIPRAGSICWIGLQLQQSRDGTYLDLWSHKIIYRDAFPPSNSGK